MPATTPSEEDAVLDKLFTKDGVFAVEWQSGAMPNDQPGFRAFYKSTEAGGLSSPEGYYTSRVALTASEAYRLARAACVADRLLRS